MKFKGTLYLRDINQNLFEMQTRVTESILNVRIGQKTYSNVTFVT